MANVPERRTLSDVVELEREGWQALSGNRSAADFYDAVLADEVVMLLPGGMTLRDRSQIIDSMSGQPWASYELEDIHVLRPASDVAVVTYGVMASRAGSSPYSALISSLYTRRDGDWKLAFHQQTPR